jgi:hypothetical protein
MQALRMDEDARWKNSRLMPYAIGVADALRGIVGEQTRTHRSVQTLRSHLKELNRMCGIAGIVGTSGVNQRIYDA